MTDTRHHNDVTFDRVVEDIASERPDPEVEREIIGRVWSKIAAETAPVRGCADFQALIPAFVAGELPDRRALLVADHTRECLPCRRALIAARTAHSEVVEATSSRRRQVPRALRLAAAAAAVVAAVLVGVDFVGDEVADRSLWAAVTQVDGSLRLVEGSTSQSLATGDRIRAHQPVRTTRGSGALLQLADGSVVEMAPRSQLSLRASRRGTTIGLERGNIIVHAADQGSRRLDVTTADCTVSVKGTIFAVNHGLKGSRVSVIEGAVAVDQGSTSTLLHPGEQVTTDASLEPVPVEEDIAWSRDAEEHIALLRELRALQHELRRAVTPLPARTSTRLLELAPEDTVIYAAIPNLTSGLGTVRQVFASQLASSEVLGTWWTEHVAEPGLDRQIEDVLDRLQFLGEAVGDEVTVGVPASALGGHGGPLVLAALDHPARFVGGLADEVSRINAAAGEPLLVLVDDPFRTSEAGAPLLLWVHGDLFAAATSSDELQRLAVRLEAGASNPFLGTELHDRLAEAYSRGVSWLVGVDVAAMTAATGAADSPEAGTLLDSSGLADATVLVVERHSSGDRATTEAVLHFAGPRRGMAAWLAPPAPMGSLDFVSPNASMVAAAVAKDPAVMVDEALELLGRTDAQIVNALEAFEREHAINVRADLAAPLGGEITVAVDGPLLPTPGWKLVVEVYDPNALQHAIEWVVDEVNRVLSAEGRPMLQLEETVVGDRTYHAIRHPLSPVAVHYLMVDGYLVAAPQRALLDQAIQLRASGITLPSSTTFRDLLPNDRHTDCSAVLYRNLEGIADALAAAGLPSLEQEGVNLLADMTAPGLFCLYGEDRQITLSGTDSSFVDAASLLSLPGMLSAVAPSARHTDG